MERKKATEFSQDILDMYDAYAHGRMSKRQFLTGASKYAVGGMTAMAIYDAMKPNYFWRTFLRALAISCPIPAAPGMQVRLGSVMAAVFAMRWR